MSSHLLRMLGALVLLAGGCTQETFVLGRFESSTSSTSEDAAAGDAEPSPPPLDASVTPSPLVVSLTAKGRTGVVQLMASCGAGCLQVRVNIAGGVPPYEVLWDDGKKGAARTLCADPVKPRSAVVHDASDGINAPATLSLGVVGYDRCGNAEPTWRVCYPVTRQIESPCPEYFNGTFAFDLGTPVMENVVVEAKMVVIGELSNVSPSFSYLYLFDDECQESSTLSTRSTFVSLGEGQKTLIEWSGGTSTSARYLGLPDTLWQTGLPLDSDESDAAVPENIVESLVLCEATQS